MERLVSALQIFRCQFPVSARLLDSSPSAHKDDEGRLYLQALGHSGDTVVITDFAGAIEYVNAAFETISGYRRNEVIGRYWTG